MRIIILGGSGLIGHKLLYRLKDRFTDVYTTLHRDEAYYQKFGIFSSQNVIYNVDVNNFEHLKGILHAVNPDVVINCIGITKRKKEIEDIAYAIYVNSVYPHLLAQWVRENGKRMIHFPSGLRV